MAKVLRAAEEVFSERGLSAPIDEVARRAGVGVGTVYRHFPTKEVLFEAIVMTRLEALAERAEQLAADPDPAHALFAHISELVRQAVAKKDLVDELGRWGFQPLERVHAEVKERLMRAGDALLRRAQAAGAVRGDVSPDDLSAMVMGACEGASCLFVDPKRRAELAQRMVEVLCAGLLVQPRSRVY
jgi:AcrR family transcriptional regulator